MEDLESLSLVDLRLVAKKWGIKGVTAYRKQELLEFLKEEQKKQGEPLLMQKRGHLPVGKSL